MALTLLHNPGTYYSAHGDLLFTLLESVKANDPVTYPDYKYVADVYIDSEFVVRLKAVPRPDTKIGVFNIANIIRNYVAANLSPAASQLRCQQMGAGEFYVAVQIEFGEEYGLTTYTNVLTDATRTYFNHYNGRLIGANTNLAEKLDKALSSRPSTTNIYRSTTRCFVPFLPTDTDDVTLSISRYAGSALVSTVTQAYTPSAANVLQQFDVSPTTINANFSGFINAAITHYTVEFQTPNIADDSLYTFNLICEPKYTVFTLHFLNRWGGWESKDFTKVSRKIIDIDKSDFGKLPYTIDASGVPSYYNSNNVYNETRSMYASQYKEKMTLNTDIVTDAEYEWLADLFLSPQVYIQMTPTFLVPCVIAGSNYEYRKVINDKLTNITANIEFGDQFNAQFR